METRARRATGGREARPGTNGWDWWKLVLGARGGGRVRARIRICTKLMTILSLFAGSTANQSRMSIELQRRGSRSTMYEVTQKMASTTSSVRAVKPRMRPTMFSPAHGAQLGRRVCVA